MAPEQRLAQEGIVDSHALRGEGELAYAAYQAAAQGTSADTDGRIAAKSALLSPLLGPADPESLEEIQQTLEPSAPLWPWLGAALCWVRAGRGETEAAATVCRAWIAAEISTISAMSIRS